MHSPVIAKNKLIPDMAFKCDDVIRRAHISRSKREQQATAPRRRSLMDCFAPLRIKGGRNAIQQCPFAQILGQEGCDRVVRLRLTIQSINSCQSSQVYQTSE